MQLVNNVKIENPDGPQAAAQAFQTSTNFVNMENYNRCMIILDLDQAGAGTATVTLKQGTTSGAGRSLAFSKFWKNEAGGDQLTQVVASTLTTAGAYTGANRYVWEVKSEDLTTTSGNKLIRCDVASLSNNTAANLEYILYEPRYGSSAYNLPDGDA